MKQIFTLFLNLIFLTGFSEIIRYTYDTPVVIGNGISLAIDFQHDGQNELSLISSTYGKVSYTSSLAANPYNSEGLSAVFVGSKVPHLFEGTKIQSSISNSVSNGKWIWSTEGQNHTIDDEYGSWGSIKGWFAVRFDGYYGYIEMQIDQYNRGEATVYGYAYNNSKGSSITTATSASNTTDNETIISSRHIQVDKTSGEVGDVFNFSKFGIMDLNEKWFFPKDAVVDYSNGLFSPIVRFSTPGEKTIRYNPTAGEIKINVTASSTYGQPACYHDLYANKDVLPFASAHKTQSSKKYDVELDNSELRIGFHEYSSGSFGEAIFNYDFNDGKVFEYLNLSDAEDDKSTDPGYSDNEGAVLFLSGFSQPVTNYTENIYMTIRLYDADGNYSNSRSLTFEKTWSTRWDDTDLYGILFKSGFDRTRVKGIEINFGELEKSFYLSGLQLGSYNCTMTTPLDLSYQVSNSGPEVNQSISFTNTTVGGQSVSWDFGANASPSSATGNGPHSVSYSKEGKSTFTLTVDGQSVNGEVNVKPSSVVYGCTDPLANNYNSIATSDNGTCTYDNNTGGSGLNNAPTASSKGYKYEFGYDSKANYCKDLMDEFPKGGISVAEKGASGTIGITFSGSQNFWETLSNKFHSTCPNEKTINLSGNKKIKARIKVSKNVRVGAFVAVDKGGQFVLADGLGDDNHYKQIQAGNYQVLEFDIPTKDWQSKSLDLSKTIGWAIGARNYNNVSQAPSGSVTFEVDWIHFGDAISSSDNSIGELENDNFKVFPNPTTGKVNLEGDFTSVRIFNLTGSLVEEFTNLNSSRLTFELNPGLYYAEVFDNNTFLGAKRIIVSK